MRRLPLPAWVERVPSTLTVPDTRPVTGYGKLRASRRRSTDMSCAWAETRTSDAGVRRHFSRAAPRTKIMALPPLTNFPDETCARVEATVTPPSNPPQHQPPSSNAPARNWPRTRGFIIGPDMDPENTAIDFSLSGISIGGSDNSWISRRTSSKSDVCACATRFDCGPPNVP